MEFLFQILLVLLLVLLNGYFVASEFSLVSVRRTRVEELAKKGNLTAKMLQQALSNIESYISATQLGVTLASLALGWIGEPAVAHVLEPYFTFLPKEAAILTSHTLAVILAFSLITYLHIVLGELTPKTVALQKSEKIAFLLIAPLVIFTKIFWPVIWFLNFSGQVVVSVMGIGKASKEEMVHSEEEVRMILSQSARGGSIPSKEVEMVYNVFQLGDTPVKFVMIPRREVIAFNIAASLKSVVTKLEKHPHSRFPVFESTIDSVIGFVHAKDIYRELIEKGNDIRLSQLDISRTILSVGEDKKIDSVLSEMRKKRIHIAVVIDQHGGTAGIVTLEDIIESLVGEIEDEFEDAVNNISKLKDGSYIISGNTLISDFKERFNLAIEGEGYSTIGGLIIGLIGHEGRIGDTIQIANLSLRIEEIEGKRIKWLKLQKVKRKKRKS